MRPRQSCRCAEKKERNGGSSPFPIIKKHLGNKKSHPLFFPRVNLLTRKLSRYGFYYSTLPEIAPTFEVELTHCNFLHRERVFLPASLLLGSVMNLKKNKQENKSFVQHTATLHPAFNIAATEFDPVVRPSAAKHFHITQGDVFIS